MAYTGRLRPKGVPFSGFRHMKGRILLVEAYERVGKSAIWLCEMVQRTNRRYVKEVPFVNVRYTKGVPFS